MQETVTWARQGDVAAVLLVAGVGRRLGCATNPPKVLLEFGGETLLERHLKALRGNGVETVSLTVGHDEDAIRREVDRLEGCARLHFVTNPRYREGSLLSLWMQRDLLRSGASILLMDGDVLYDQALMTRLLAADGENILLVDRDIEPGDEPVKICFQGERIVDFRKKPEKAHDWHGESVGFFRFSAKTAAALADRCDAYVERGQTDLEYEEAIRDLILHEPERFSAVDVSDLAWTEIDFAVDVARARQSILPQLGE
jgi:choline kinase